MTISDSKLDDFDIQAPVEETLASKPLSDGSAVSAELMRLYYARLFPFSQMYQWLSYGRGMIHPVK